MAFWRTHTNNACLREACSANLGAYWFDRVNCLPTQGCGAAMVLDTSKHPWLCAEHGARTVESQHVGMVSYHVCVCNGRGENSGDDPVGCEGPRRR